MGVKVRWVPARKQFFIFINHNGKRKAIAVGTDKRKATIARNVAADQLLKGRMGLEPKVVSPTLDVYVATWLKTRVAQRCKSSTVYAYKQTYERYIRPVFGSTLVAEITTKDVIDKLIPKWRDDGRREETLKLIVRVLSAALTDAKEYLPVNPVVGATDYCKRPDEIEFTIDPLTAEESTLFLTAAHAATPREYPLFVTAIRTGLRIGELLALEWGDVDLHGRFITVRRTVNDRLHTITGPKGNRTRRVDLSEQAADVLQTLLTARKAEKLAKGWADLPTLVFVAEHGKAYRTNKIRDGAMCRALTKAGLRHIRFHDLRHTFASELLRMSAPISYVKEQLGHASINITVDTYGHLMPGANRAWVNKLDDTTQSHAARAPRVH